MDKQILRLLRGEPMKSKTTNLRFTDLGFAVFNSHVNKAGERAIEVCRQTFKDDDEGMIKLEQAYKDGIMAIFDGDKTPPASLFAHACFIYANGF